MKVRLKETYEAVQWFKDGDHSKVFPVPDKYRSFSPVIEGAKGVIQSWDTSEDMLLFISPGDWIIEDDGFFSVCNPGAFDNLYEQVCENPGLLKKKEGS